MSKITFRTQIYYRLFVSLAKRNVTSIEIKLNDEKKVQVDEEHQFGKKYTIKKLQQLLGISVFTAQGIANTTKSLSFVNGKMMTNSCEILKKNGITKETILKYPNLLASRDLEKNLEICKQLVDDINETAPFLLLQENELVTMIMKGVTKNRLNVLAELLQVKS